MKYWKPIVLFSISIGIAIAISQAYPTFSSKLKNAQSEIVRQGSLVGLTSHYSESCLSPDQQNRPTWECYEIPIASSTGSSLPHQTVSIQHESGEQYQVLTFQDDQRTKFRFTPTQQGIWFFSTGGQITINADRAAYAKGFVTTKGNQWIRSATGKAFVPQFVMYDKADLDTGLDEFIDGHGFDGFHIVNLRDLMKNPAYFEAVVLKTYRRGGITHFWLWGDESRKLTPSSYDVDVELLYREIAARLAPIPGWTLGYGFDLFEWATAKEIEEFRVQLRERCSYYHLIGARGYTNEYRDISPNLDYVSWEWHHPTYQDYQDHLAKANQRPTFSEDRFRIWGSNHPRDYDSTQTRQGLWHSAMAGGVANIWGHQPEGEEFSAPYPNKAALRTYNQFMGSTFNGDMVTDNTLISTGGYCLRDTDKLAICYVEQSKKPATVRLNLEKITAPLKLIAVDTQAAYAEVEIEETSGAPTVEWQPPYASDWAFCISAAS